MQLLQERVYLLLKHAGSHYLGCFLSPWYSVFKTSYQPVFWLFVCVSFALTSGGDAAGACVSVQKDWSRLLGWPPVPPRPWPADVGIIICILINVYMVLATGQSVFTVGKPSSITTNMTSEICIYFPFKEQGMLTYPGLTHGGFW